MRIGITTFHWANNYGAMLQASSLQTFLHMHNHPSDIINYQAQPPVAFVRRCLSSTPIKCLNKWEGLYKSYQFESFRRKYLKFSHHEYTSQEDLRHNYPYDLLISGSDQIWNPQLLSQIPKLFDYYFLLFANQNVRKISYAASFGYTDTSGMKKDWIAKIKKGLLHMDAISVREASGVCLVHQICGRTDATQVVDPTLLLSSDHYEKMVDRSIERKPILFTYILHNAISDHASLLNDISHKLDLQVLKCDSSKTPIHKQYILPSVNAWLSLIKMSSFVVTNSFHGTIFSLIFKTPFIAILQRGEKETMNSRILELLDTVGLSDRIISPGEKPSSRLLSKSIDWKTVDKSLENLRAKSVNYLLAELKRVHA